MSSSWRRDDLPQLVNALAGRPGHERLRTLIADILRHGFGAEYLALDHEVRLPEVRGRADLLFGATVLELKRDLRRELGDALAQLPGYLRERERRTGRRYLGIATDGATFIACELRDGILVEIGRHETRADAPDALLAWLEPALSNRDDLVPDPLVVQRELGRGSLTFGRARRALEALWARLGDHPEVRLKRELWDGLLRSSYGDAVGDDALFLQHTYLTVVAKTLAARVLDLPAEDATAILSGQALAEAGIHGAVESDFFDWVLLEEEGHDLVRRIARQVARFRLRDVEVDILKALYESLIDPEQRHDLGEYYTPDWLAARMVATVVPDPLTARVLDPACGSGTFLFQALRRLIVAARAAGWPDADTLVAAAKTVRGLDVHPVAVIIARVTWLLGLGDAVRSRAGGLHVPVYLGDAMQWTLAPSFDTPEVMLPVPGEGPLNIPGNVAGDQARFEPALRELSWGLGNDAPRAAVERALARIAGVTADDASRLADTYDRLCALKASGRNGIWPFILRNLTRPVWLSRPEQQADVVIGNPPWVAYRHLSAEMKPELRDACQAMGLWAGGVLTTQQDLAALFWARSVERYLRPGGTIAFVLPYAALSRPAYAGLRAGDYRTAKARITAAWSLERLRELFPQSSCVLFAVRAEPGPLPETVERLSGIARPRHASEAEVARSLVVGEVPWPPLVTLEGRSLYRERFRDGATIYPRRFFLVEREPAGRIGINPDAPRVHGRTGSMDKLPWSRVEPPSGPVESQFLRPLLLGETIAPFRLLAPALAVLPIDGETILDAAQAAAAGHRHLAAWLRDIEAKWAANASRRTDGTPRMTLRQQIDHMRKLSIQLDARPLRVVYTKSGTRLSAAMVEDPNILVDHKAYWCSAHSLAEGCYLCTLVNSDHALAQVIPMQAHGWRDPRDFDNLLWELPIPGYDSANPLHAELADAGAEAERLAAEVRLPEGHFTMKRRAIRSALAEAGIAQRIEALVARLLNG